LRNQLIVASGVFAALPGLYLILGAGSSILQLIGLAIVSLGGLLGLFSFFTSRASVFAWFALILSLFTLIVGNGYLSTVINVGLGFNEAVAEDFALSVVLIELAIVASSIFGTYHKYSKELEKAGYNSEEYKSELGSFGKFMIFGAFAVALVSCGLFFLLEFVPQIQIDTISGLIIAMIVYFVVASYVLKRP
jgi:hypothetical protein